MTQSILDLANRILKYQSESYEDSGILEFAAAIRAQTIDECAAVCRDKSRAEYATGQVDHNEMAWCDSCAIDIRKLKEPK